MKGRLLISQDLSCVGQVSMGVALPILGTCGYNPAVLPTALLSTHTGGFGNNTFLNLSSEIPKILNHWQEIPIHFSSIYLGYLGKEALEAWLTNFDKVKQDKQTVLLDPVMGDNGKFYSGMDQDYAKKMQLLAKKATILTPNLTEACLLLNYPLEQMTESLEFAQQIMKKLTAAFPNKKIVITGISLPDKKIGIVGYDNQVWTLLQEKIGRSYFGTGDIFASVLLATYLSKNSLEEAAKIAANFVQIAIKNTNLDQDTRLGPNYAAGLTWLLEKIKDKGRK